MYLKMKLCMLLSALMFLLFVSLGQTQMGGMPEMGGMPDLTPEQMEQFNEMMRDPEKRAQMEAMAQQMGGMGGGMPGMGGGMPGMGMEQGQDGDSQNVDAGDRAMMDKLFDGSSDSAKCRRGTAVPEDVKYIMCEACKFGMRVLKKQAQVLREDKKRLGALGEKVKKGESELAYFHLLEGICDVTRESGGEWILYYDMVEEGDKIKLVDMKEAGECGSECKTITRACEKVFTEYEIEIAEALYSQEYGKKLTSVVCNQMSDACAKKLKPVPASRQPGPAFVPRNETEYYLRLTAKMKGGPLGNLDPQNLMMDMVDDPNKPQKMRMSDVTAHKDVKDDEQEFI